MSDSLLDGHLHRGCGGRYVRETEPVTVRVSGMVTTVDRVFFRCSRCNDETRTVEQREAAEQAAVLAIREQHTLLLPKQIRQLRERLGLTTEQLGDLLYGIPRSIIEGLEKGRYVQNRETDAMLRRLEDDAFLRDRAARSGVLLPERPEEPGALEQGAADGQSSAPTDAPPDPAAVDPASVPAAPAERSATPAGNESAVRPTNASSGPRR